MKQVVYLLGAGFSAPLGIPVMADFLQKAKDQYYGDRKRFNHFGQVLETINSLHVANSYYATDLFNIEDILSILDLKGRLAGVGDEKEFRRFIADVITFHTPPLHTASTTQRWDTLLFWERPWCDYGPFVASLLGYEFVREAGLENQQPKKDDYVCRAAESLDVSYAVVTLNYDAVLETAVSKVNATYGLKNTLARVAGKVGVPLAKLHGSIDSDDIVPPIWSKSLTPLSIRQSWQVAYELLKAANEIRIIGYSLPESDAYVRYLLRAAVIDTPNLKRIDVLCKDNGDKEIERRYRGFVTFRHFKFNGTTTETYLRNLSANLAQWPQRIGPDLLEDAHKRTFGY